MSIHETDLCFHDHRGGSRGTRHPAGGRGRNLSHGAPLPSPPRHHAPSPSTPPDGIPPRSQAPPQEDHRTDGSAQKGRQGRDAEGTQTPDASGRRHAARAAAGADLRARAARRNRRHLDRSLRGAHAAAGDPADVDGPLARAQLRLIARRTFSAAGWLGSDLASEGWASLELRYETIWVGSPTRRQVVARRCSRMAGDRIEAMCVERRVTLG
jgi:hypothetical protein